MNYLKLSALLALSFYLSSCGPPTPPGVAPPAGSADTDAPIDRDYEAQRNNNRENRRRTFEKSRNRYSGGVCEDEERDHECKDQCKDIYTRRKDREDCEELRISQIEVLEELHKLIKDPDDDDLAELDLEDFEVYLDISTSPFDKLVGKYSKGESKEMLLWIAENEDVAELLKDKDDEFKILYKLLEEVASDGDKGSNIYKYFIAKIDSGDKLMEVVIDSGNESAHNWFLDFINSEHSLNSSALVKDCNEDTESENCFKQYCLIGNDIDNDISEDWLGFEEFDEYIENIIDEEVNGHASNSNCWDTDIIDDVSDVNDWVKELCIDLLDPNTTGGGDGCKR